jgi:pyridoxal phosphate enzyme (YggS family)
VVEPVGPLDPQRVRANLEAVRDEIAGAARRAGRDAVDVEILAAVKYVRTEDLGALAEAGITLLGENRAQDLEAKAAAYPAAFTWDFIGQLQSRKVKQILPHVRLIHSVASESALTQLDRHAEPGAQILVEVNVAGEGSKAGVRATDLPAFLERCAEVEAISVAGLMTMPPWAEDPEASRPCFARLAELAAVHGLRHLSMGTTQDFAVAVQEGATIVRVGSRLYA